MAFVRRKVVAGRVYRYEVESERGPDGVVRQRVLRYLGPEWPVYGTAAERRPARKRGGSQALRGA